MNRCAMQDDIALATDAMNKLQGAMLPSSERGGIRIEYARTKMGDVVSRTRSGSVSDRCQSLILRNMRTVLLYFNVNKE